MLRQGWNDTYTDFCYDEEEIYRLCLVALRSVYEAGVLKQHDLDPRMTIILFMGDQFDAERVKWVEYVNSPAIAQRLAQEIATGHQAYRTLYANEARSNEAH
jgi:hypothetical protein